MVIKRTYGRAFGGAPSVTVRVPPATRAATEGSFIAARRAAAARRRRTTGPFRVGYDRLSGFYGRFPPTGPELKFLDTTISSVMTATGSVPATGGQLNLIAQGTTESQRIGRKVVIKSIHILGTCLSVFGVTAAPAAVAYMVLVWDKQCNGAAAAVTDVFTSADLSTSLPNMANNERFIIIKRFKFRMYPQAGVSGAFGDLSIPIKYYRKCNIPVEFSSTTGAITEIKSNNLFLLTGLSSSTAASVVQIAAKCRIRFDDQ